MQSKCSRVEEVSKDKSFGPNNAEQETRVRSTDGDRNRDKGKEPVERDLSIRTLGSRTPSWLGEGFQMSATQTELIKLVVEVGKSALVLRGLRLTDPRMGRFIGDGVVERCINFNTLKSISSIRVNDSLGLFGAHLAQVNNCRTMFILIA